MSILALVSVLACLSPAMAAGGTGDTRAGDGLEAPQSIVLRLSLPAAGEELEVTALPGQPIRIHDRDSDIIYELIASFEPSTETRIALQAVEVLTLGRTEARSLVDALPLPTEGSIAVFDDEIRVALVELRPLSESLVSAEPQELRSTNCCITCNGITACGHCVSMSCGSCCVQN